MQPEKTMKQISLRITDTMQERLEAEAKAQGRPVANYIKAIINAHFESMDRLKQITDKK